MKFSLAEQLQNHTANTIAKHFVCQFDLPDSVLTDQGPDFMSKFLKSVASYCTLRKSTQRYITHNRMGLERSHRTLVEYLRHYVNEKKQDWDDIIPYAMFTYNSTIYSSTKFQPQELVYGYPTKDPRTLSRNPQPCCN